MTLNGVITNCPYFALGPYFTEFGSFLGPGRAGAQCVKAVEDTVYTNFLRQNVAQSI